MRAATAAVALLFAAACGGGGPAQLPPPRETPGRTTPLEVASPLPEGHPPVPTGDPASNDERIGRAARRMNVDQLRASLLAATGFSWVAARRVSDPDAPTGFTQLPDADMLDALAATLGRPDYVTSTHEATDPAVSFTKLANDAARSACRASVQADVKAGQPGRLLRFATAKDSVASNAAAIKQNLAYLALRFWGRRVAPDDPELATLLTLFERASTAEASKDAGGTARPAATPADGWRAVCIAMATDPQFLTY